MFVILSTCDRQGGGNVGDQLITESAIHLLKSVTGEEDFRIFFRGDDLSPHLDTINQARAIVLPGFAIRENMYPSTYRLVPDLDDLEPPLLPMGTGCKALPGTFSQIDNFRFSPKDREFLHRIAAKSIAFTCRDLLSERILENNGIDDVRMVGDCAWYHQDFVNERFDPPSTIDSLVFTTGHYKRFSTQGIDVVDRLSTLFPDAKKFCAVHSAESPEYVEELIDHATRQGFEPRRVSHDVANLDFYRDVDLHVGYRVHGHLAFLRLRKPSFLLHEDSRGLGMTYSFGGGGMSAYEDHSHLASLYRWLPYRETKSWMGATSLTNCIDPGARTRTLARKILNASVKFGSLRAGGPVADTVKNFLQEEMESGFRRYYGIFEVIDRTYSNEMKPVLELL